MGKFELFYKMITPLPPKKTMIMKKKETCHKGKLSKDRLTCSIRCQLRRIRQVKAIVDREIPQSFKNVKNLSCR